MFIDQARITVKAGDGGDGAVSFHTEKYITNGGPDGGDGGRGGDVVMIPRTGIRTLQAFRYRRKFAAEDGEKGGARKQYGRSGKDLIIEIPVGTLVKDAETGRILADLVIPDKPVIIAHGGKGGKGNVHFANSVRQAPRFARTGEPGDMFEAQVELKLIADVGLVGFPNAGKSTLLASISAAKPKIGNYPFTTLEPMLGVVSYQGSSFVVADIPGLIAGAHTGLGLGLSFLRHIERTRLILHVIDLSFETGRDPLADFDQINEELRRYDPVLLEKPQIVVLNKIDLAEPETVSQIQTTLKQKGFVVYSISAATGSGVTQLIQAVAETVAKLPPAYPFTAEEDHVVYRFEEEDLF
ncbi:MAG: GTPase ObgE, partial [Eubacteriales bacterium]|nr:GTPase ObgE [Eubacteriales bacterium]